MAKLNVDLPFTTPRLHALAAKPARYEVRDGQWSPDKLDKNGEAVFIPNGLILRVTPSGVKTFCAYAWVPLRGKPERITIGKFPSVGIDAARKRAAVFMETIAEGRSPRPRNASPMQAIRSGLPSIST